MIDVAYRGYITNIQIWAQWIFHYLVYAFIHWKSWLAYVPSVRDVEFKKVNLYLNLFIIIYIQIRFRFSYWALQNKIKRTRKKKIKQPFKQNGFA